MSRQVGLALMLVVCTAWSLAATRAAAQELQPQNRPLPLDPELPYCASTDGLSHKHSARAALCSVGYTAVPVAGGALMVYGSSLLADTHAGPYAASTLGAAGVALFSAGVLIGPSVGSWYARDGRTARIGVGLGRLTVFSFGLLTDARPGSA